MGARWPWRSGGVERTHHDGRRAASLGDEAANAGEGGPGAGWLVPLCGDIQQMPGLGKAPAALNVDVDAEGRTVGLF
ncbi:MAG: formate--tetrahydrofolate ligase [Thermoleophilaceae bacterium]